MEEIAAIGEGPLWVVRKPVLLLEVSEELVEGVEVVDMEPALRLQSTAEVND
ncbi:MAG: hypothetical protein ABI382_11190 [Nakamurella sp.]